MPLVRIELIEGRTPEQVRLLSDAVHQALVEDFATPVKDRLQVIQQHRPEHMILLDLGLGFERADTRVLLQVFSQGRTSEQKQAFYAKVVALFSERGIADPQDVVISMSDNTRADWSFGLGRSQFLAGAN
jgi:phenylpyruvate tautomerase PptA (4-oxalocrotonate tautomerase family)